MTRQPADDQIWREIRALEESTGWPPQAIKDMVAMKLEITVERVTDVWRARLAGFGG